MEPSRTACHETVREGFSVFLWFWVEKSLKSG